MNDDMLHNELKILESKLLPKDCNFSDEQREVIYSNACANVVAGPGSGKTTVLIAKIALTLSQMKSQVNASEKGICIITHTNVAVDK
ncbi:AAA family ATPase [Aquibacillus halophilus]|uniref:AAA family ATPase n=1 Tax=Aquibacillus halophilus TaxID=930132 RepID=A0A6A8D900_9BACI|nr:UvrD-helicase domain-containing protein [Aquibacillus halophilus]MRH42068.1 AAA family ATPase [Aquibacillus halophilus]